MPTCWLSSQHSPGTPPSNTWCLGRTSTSRAGREHAENRQHRWRWLWWWMFFDFSLSPQGAGWNTAETGSFGARGRLCELNYATYCDTHTCTCTNPLVVFSTDTRLRAPYMQLACMQMLFSHSLNLFALFMLTRISHLPQTVGANMLSDLCSRSGLVKWFTWSLFICKAPGEPCCFACPPWQVAYSIIYCCWWW